MTLFDTLRRSRLARISLTRREPTEATAVRLAAPPEPAAAALPEGAPRLRDWIGVLAMGTGLFMAIMDVQIVTSSLTQIQGGLSASTDDRLGANRVSDRGCRDGADVRDHVCRRC